MKILASRVLFRPADYQRSLSFYRDAIGLAITREYGSGTVFYAGQSLIELASHGAPAESGGPFPGVLWLQVRDAYATQAELEGRAQRQRCLCRLNKGGYAAMKAFGKLLGVKDAPGLDLPGLNFEQLAAGFGLYCRAGRARYHEVQHDRRHGIASAGGTLPRGAVGIHGDSDTEF